MKEYWIYQRRQVPKPFALMLDVYRDDMKKASFDVTVYQEDIKGSLYIEHIQYSRCWQIALAILRLAEISGLCWTMADIINLEQDIADVLDDFITFEHKGRK